MAFCGKLIRSGGNAKTIKGDKASEYETAIMYLAPYTSAGGANVCPMAETAKCIEGCLNTAGRAGLFEAIPAARKRKTQQYLNNRKQFLQDLVSDIEAFARYCARKGVKPAVRLNGTSDIQWERGHAVELKCGGPIKGERFTLPFTSIMAAFPEVQFYDYTKIPQRLLRGQLPANYTLTLSYSGASAFYAEQVVQTAKKTGCNVAVVFRSKAQVARMVSRVHHDGLFPLPSIDGPVYASVIDGDLTDLRFLDPKGVVVALYAKGKAKKDTSGFVVD